MTINEYDQWLGVELRHLAALAAVAEEGSFGRAARRLGYTQSAVSQQIAQLEKLVGATLLERPGGPRAVSLTDGGRLLLRHADAIVARLHAAQADMAALLAGEAGPLRVGILQSVGARLLPGLIRRFKEDFPRVSVQVHEGSSDDELLPLVESGDLDLAFAELPLPEGPFEWVELLRDPYVLLVAADSPLAERDTAPPLRELARLPLIGWRSDRDTDLTGVEYAFRSDDNGTVLGLVESGLGVAVAPSLVLRPERRGIVALPFGSRRPPRLLGLVWHAERYRSPAAAGFVEDAIALAANLRDEGDGAADRAGPG
jgi:molybdate transport repressor ModE-like protein